jgi:endonuclease/exonuclease/phosphatase family metal-dependent hydrolase
MSGSGLLLLSRWPLRERAFERYELRGRPERIWHGDWHGHKGFVRAEVETPQGPVSLVNTHLHARYGRDRPDEYLGVRIGQVVQFAAALAQVDEPVVAVGDFNFDEGSPEYSVLAGLAGLRDSAAELDARKPTSRSERRIDFVFVRDGGGRALLPTRVKRVLDREVELEGERGTFSDHRGVLAELELVPTAANASRSRATEAARELAARLLAEGRAGAERRKTGREIGAGVTASAAVLGLAATRLGAVTRRRWLRLALAVGAAAALPTALGLLALAEVADAGEVAAFDQVQALLASGT